MAGVYKGLTIKLDADTTGLHDALSRVERDTKGLGRNMRAVTKALKLDPGNVELVRQKMANYAKQVGNTEERLKVLKAAESQLGKEKMSSEAWDALQRDIARTQAKLDGLKQSWRQFTVQTAAASSGLGKAGAKVEELGRRLSPVARAASSVGGALTLGLTVPMVAAGGASIAAAVSIDSALTNVRKTVDGTEADCQRLKESAIEFSKTNPVSAAQVLEIEALGAQLGFSVDKLEEFGRVVSGLDIATNLDAETAATQLAQFMNIMGTSKDEVSNLASSLIDLGNHYATTEADIMAMAMRIAGAGKQMGMTEGQVLGLATALSSVGIEAEAGGTAISTIMSTIDMAVAKNDSSLADWASAAKMSASEFAAAWKKSPAEAFQAFLAGLQQGVAENGNLSVMLDELGISSIRQLDVMKRLASAAGMVPDALRQGNEAYAQNIALGNEVANFNDSLASKFDMLKNRIIAIADQIGRPLADALLDIVDAAQPLFDAIESGAQAFADMDEGQQRLIITTVGLIAALGPSLKLFGSIAGNVEVLGKAMKGASEFIAQMGAKSIVAKGGMEALGTSTDKQVNRAGKLAVASNVAKGALVGLAVAGVAVLASAIADALGKMYEYKNATDGLAGAIGAFGAGADASAASVGSFFTSSYDLAKEQSKLASDIRSSFEDVGVNSALVDIYKNKIVELAGNCGGSAAKVAELKQAIDGYTSITGESIEITDSETGAINKSTAELDANSEAWKRNAKAKALQEAAADVMKQAVKDEMAYKDAKRQREIAEAGMNAATDPSEIAQYKGNYDYWIGEEERLKGLYESSTKAAEEYTDELANLEEQQRWDADAAGEFRKQLEAAGLAADMLDQAASKTGEDAATLATKLHDTAGGFEAFAALGVDAFSALHSQADMDIPAIVELVGSLNALQLDPKQLTVTSDGSLEYQGEAIEDLDALEIDPKTYTVNDDGTITTQNEKLQGLNYVRIGDKVYQVTDNGTAEECAGAADHAADSVNGIPSSKSVKITATDATGWIIEQVKSKLRSIPGMIAAKVGSFFGDKSGGFVKLHASGGFVTDGITSLGRDAHGIQHIAGEDGREWIMQHADGTKSIVPIENRRYLEPYASTIASMIKPAGNTTTNNIRVVLQYDASSNAKDLARGFTRALEMEGLMR